jgi:hypothetical protein
MWVANGATVTLVDCTFGYNVISDTYPNSATLSINAVDTSRADSQLQDTIVVMKRCEFRDNSAPHDVVTNKKYFANPEYSALVYTDVPLLVSFVSDDGANKTLGFSELLSAAPSGRQGISDTSAWLQKVQQVRLSRASSLHASLPVSAPRTM